MEPLTDPEKGFDGEYLEKLRVGAFTDPIKSVTVLLGTLISCCVLPAWNASGIRFTCIAFTRIPVWDHYLLGTLLQGICIIEQHGMQVVSDLPALPFI